jgi:hypothetical protein
VVRPRAYDDNTTSSTSPSRRCRFFTITGSKLPSRSRGTSSSTCPAAWVSTVLALVPLRTLPATGLPCFSCPRCSVISSFSAVSSTTLFRCLSSPSGPVNDNPCSFASRTNSLAAISSTDQSGFFLAVIPLSVVVITAAPLLLNTQLSASGRKHR